MPHQSSTDVGLLSPPDAIVELYENGVHHLHQATQLVVLKNIYGGILFSFAGLFSVITSTGSGLGGSSPGIERLIHGATFPIGLVIVYFVGAELFTGYPMLLTLTALQRDGRPIQYLKAFLFSWIGNLIGALFGSVMFSYLTQSLAEEPFKSGLINHVNSDIVSSQWHVIFLKAIACGQLVTLAMLFGTQNHDGVSKAIGLHLPFFISTTARFPHTVEYMYLGSTGMMLGAPLSVGGFLWKCMLPITLGNTIGGALFVGAYNWWVLMYCEDKGQAKDRWAETIGDGERH